MKRVLLLLLSTLALGSCRCDDPILIDMGPIPDSILALVPYQDGQVYQFRHSAGKVITYAAHRALHEEYFDCERCCKFLYKYQVNQTALVPDYPVFTLNVQLSNPDSSRLEFSAWMGQRGFNLSMNQDDGNPVDRIDSAWIGEQWHKDVLRIRNSNYFGFSRDSIYADTLYYNYQSGILKIVMSNGEYFQIHE